MLLHPVAYAYKLSREKDKFGDVRFNEETRKKLSTKCLLLPIISMCANTSEQKL